MYSDVKLLADLGPVYSSTSKFRKKDIAAWLEDCKDKIYDLVQSAETITD